MTEDTTLAVLLSTAASIAALHTVIGVDHSLPFIVLGRARGWPLGRVLCITALCGLGHVLSSFLLGGIGLGVGVALERLEWLEEVRGGWGAWALILFGLVYAARALWRTLRSQPHQHSHVHRDGVVHTHAHDHRTPEHRHVHAEPAQSTATIGALFVIFVLGPCEPLIPLLMAPAAMHHMAWALLVGCVFGAVTIGAMLVVVAIGYMGLSQVRFAALGAHADLLAGLAIAGSGIAIRVFGI